VSSTLPLNSSAHSRAEHTPSKARHSQRSFTAVLQLTACQNRVRGICSAIHVAAKQLYGCAQLTQTKAKQPQRSPATNSSTIRVHDVCSVIRIDVKQLNTRLCSTELEWHSIHHKTAPVQSCSQQLTKTGSVPCALSSTCRKTAQHTAAQNTLFSTQSILSTVLHMAHHNRFYDLWNPHCSTTAQYTAFSESSYGKAALVTAPACAYSLSKQLRCQHLAKPLQENGYTAKQHSIKLTQGVKCCGSSQISFQVSSMSYIKLEAVNLMV
jgi:hypothetical protein